MQPPNKSKRHTERRPSRNTLIEEVIPLVLVDSKMPAIPSLTLRKDSFMMSMESKVSRTEDHLVWEATFLIFSIQSRKTTGQRK